MHLMLLLLVVVGFVLRLHRWSVGCVMVHELVRVSRNRDDRLKRAVAVLVRAVSCIGPGDRDGESAQLLMTRRIERRGRCRGAVE